MAEVVVSFDFVVTLQEKVNGSLQAGGKTMFRRMFAPIGGNSRNTRLKVFKFADLKRATRDFSQDLLLDKDAFGKVFLGWVDKNTFGPSTEGFGIAVAVTRYIYLVYENVSIVRLLTHPNILRLLGYCIDQEHSCCLLVHEYIHDRNLGHFLFTNAQDVAEPLSWETRLKIMIGVARGLAYMHSLKDQVIHGDVKPSNIWFDKEFNAKLGGVILQNSDDNYSVQSDVFSFGVLLLETLTGQRVLKIDFRHLVDSASPVLDSKLEERIWKNPITCFFIWKRSVLADKNEVKKIIDPRLGPNYPQEAAFKCILLASRCIAPESSYRPSTGEVLMNLEQIKLITNNE